MPTCRRWCRPCLAAAALGLLVAAGCDSALETGYEPRSLNASQADRRSYYAPAYSPEAQSEKSGTGFNLAP